MLISVLILGLTACAPTPENKLQKVKDAGELVVLTRNSPTTYYEGAEGYSGIEYEMVQAFARYLGVQARFVVPENSADILPMLTRNEADMAAAGLAVSKHRRKLARFTTSYQQVTQNVIYRYGTHPPESLAALQGKYIEIPAGSHHDEHLRQLQPQYPNLKWQLVQELSNEDLLRMVWEGLLEFTIADSNIFQSVKSLYPELRSAFPIAKPDKLAWAFPLTEDKSLYRAGNRFLKKLRKSGRLKQLMERYYGAARASNPVNMTVYQLRIQNRLPKYQSMFEQAGKETGLDWRLLAAMGYQESFWNPRAKSPTGVRGIMMLTRGTARQMGVKDRLNPEQAILGGGRYIKHLRDRLPESIPEPDRTWFALAAYNVGLGHLADARGIAKQRQGNPDSWADVQSALPLLSRHAWYKNTKHGYARGIEPVRFVTRIRNYHEVLVRLDEEEQSAQQSDAIQLTAPAI